MPFLQRISKPCFKRNFARVFFALVLLSVLYYRYLYLFGDYSNTSPPTNFSTYNFKFPSNLDIAFSKLKRKVVIGTVCCRTDLNTQEALQKTEVMIKSVLISALLYNVNHVEIHLLLEYKQDLKYFSDKIDEFGLEEKGIKVNLYFTSAIEPVPEKKTIYSKRFRCGHTRLYFPTALSEVDSIIYLDTDFIITGNKYLGALDFIWKYDGRFFKNGLPYVKPEGVNSGLILMNLTRLRNYNWANKLSKVWDNYVPKSTKRIGDQTLLNILLHHNQSIMYQIPCQFNVRCTQCNHAMFCKNVSNDPLGIHGVHGASSQFQNGKRFEYIFHQYAMFDLKNGDIIKDLMKPIRNSNEPVSSSKHCNEKINPHLFKNHL